MKLCFCKIPFRTMKAVAIEKYLRGISTIQILEKCHGEKERQYVATVALLDIGSENLKQMVRNGEVACDFFACRERMRKAIEHEGLLHLVSRLKRNLTRNGKSKNWRRYSQTLRTDRRSRGEDGMAVGLSRPEWSYSKIRQTKNKTRRVRQ